MATVARLKKKTPNACTVLCFLKQEWVQAEVIKCVLLYIYKTTRVQKSQSTDIFCLFVCLFWREYIDISSDKCSKQPLRQTRGKQRDYNQTFIKSVCLSVCLQSGTLCSRETRGNIEKYDIRSGQHGSRDPGGEALGGGDVHLGARPSSFWFFWPPPPLILDQKTHFVLHIFCCFAITTRVQQ